MAALVLLGGCSGVPTVPTADSLAADSPEVELAGVPFFPDTRYFCGPAVLAAALNWSGRDTSPESLAAGLYVPERRGTLQPELAARARRAGRLAFAFHGDLQRLGREISAGQPVIVLQNLALPWWPRWHYSLAVGVRPHADGILLRSGTQRRRWVDATVFDRTWARSQRWALVLTPPGVLPATATAQEILVATAALEQTAGTTAALPYWRAGVRRFPGAGRLHAALGNAFYSLGDITGALRALEHGAATAQRHRGVVLNNLAAVLAEAGQLARAEEWARAATRVDGRHEKAARQTLDDIRCRRRGCRD